MTETDSAPKKENRTVSSLMYIALTFALVAINIAAIFQLSEHSRVERMEARLLEGQVRLGSGLYVANCAFCHGDDGSETRGAPSLSNLDFLSSVSDDFLQHTIAEGRPRTVMPAWGQDEGGPFTAEDIAAIVAFIRNWEDPQVEMGRTTTASGLQADSLQGGRETFKLFCSDCHGDDGEIPAGSKDIIANSPERLDDMTEDEVRQQILYGGEEMPGLENLLSVSEMDGLIKFMHSWPREHGE